MKTNRYLFVVALTVALLLGSCLVSCSQEIPVTEPEETPAVEETVYDKLQEDSKTVISKLGEVSCVYEQDSSRYINGQEIKDSYLDKEGKAVPVSFNSWLVAYKTIAPEYLALFDKIEFNAKLHNTHGYSIKDLSEKETYVEYCEYRFLDASDYNNIGDLCFIEIRLVCKDIKSDGWYAKSLIFDPKMQYEISWLNINVATGERVSYDIRSGSAGAPSRGYQYDDDGKLSQRTNYNNKTGDETGHVEYEYDDKGKLSIETRFDKSGNVSSSYVYEYEQATGNMIKRTTYGADGNMTLYYEYEYNYDGNRTKTCGYRASGKLILVETFDGTSAERTLSYISYDESDNETFHYEQEFNADGFLTKYSRIFSETTKYEYEFDGFSEMRVYWGTYYNSDGVTGYDDYFESDGKTVGSVSYDINGEITSRQETEYNSDGYKTKTIIVYPSGEKTEDIYDGTSDGRWLGQIKYDETGNITSWWEFEYNSDGYRTKETSFYGSGVVCQESIYDGTAEKKRLSLENFDQAGNLTRREEYNPSTGKVIKRTQFNVDGSISSWTAFEYDQSTGNKIGEIKYDSDGIKYSENEYDPYTGDRIKETRYKADGTISSWAEYEYDSVTGITKSYTTYKVDDGSKIEREFNPSSGLIEKEVHYDAGGIIFAWSEFDYNSDRGTTIKTEYYADGTKHIESEYNPITGKYKRYTRYNADGTKSSESEYDPSTGNVIKTTDYNADGTISGWGEYEYDPSTGKQIKETWFNADGTKSSETEYDPSTGNRIKSIWYYADGTKDEYEYDPSTGKQIKSIRYDADGAVSGWYESEYDPSTGKQIKRTVYYADGKKDEYEYDPSTGNRIKFISYNADGRKSEQEYDPSTGNIIKGTYYYADGTKSSESEYDPSTGNTIKTTTYNAAGTISGWGEYEYDPSTGKQIKETWFNADGTKSSETEYDPSTGNTIKTTYYNADGTISGWDEYEYDQITGNRIKAIWYYADETISGEAEYDSSTGNTIKTTKYNADGTKSFESEYDPSTGKLIKETWYDADGTISSETEYNPITGNTIKTTFYNADGTKSREIEYDPSTGNKIKTTDYNADGTKFREYEYDPITGDLLKRTTYDAEGNITKVYTPS